MGKDLVIDIGNTNKKLALFDGETLAEMQQFPLLTVKTLEGFLDLHPDITSCILASVIHHPAAINHHLSSRLNFMELDERTPIPVVNRYQTAGTLGKDRLAAAVAGHNRFPGENVLVVNAGTCITYEFIGDNHEYLGGAISPGIGMRFRALHTFTGKLPLISFREADILTGTDTTGSILSGVLTGAVAEIEGVAARYAEKYPGLHVILSGGDQNYFDKRLKINIFAFPNIVIHGLHQILAFNVNKTK